MTIVGLIVFLIVVGVLFWAVRALAGAFGIPVPVVVVVQVVLVVGAVLYLLSAFGLMAGGPVIRLR